MENKTNRSYNHPDYNDQDIPNTNLEKTELNNDLNQLPENKEGLEEFTNDQPNRFNNEDRNQDINSANNNNNKDWDTNPLYNPDDDFEEDSDMDDADLDGTELNNIIPDDDDENDLER